MHSTSCPTDDALTHGSLQGAHWDRDESMPEVDGLHSDLAPRAGGTVRVPRRLPDAWEWDVLTDIRRRGDSKALAGAEGATLSVGSDINAAVASSDELVKHRGGCHCGQVRFEVIAPASLIVWDCNCSDCRMRRNVHFIVPAGCLKLIVDSRGGEGGADDLAEYRWGTGAARHYFCARCGISPFYCPRSNPDGHAVTFQCLDAGTVSAVEVRRFDGEHWEDFIEGQGSAIRGQSRPRQSSNDTQH